MTAHAQRRFLVAAALFTLAAACSGQPGGCACPGFTQLPQGSYTGPRLDTSGAVRFTQGGFTVLNQNAASILQFFAPGNRLVVPVPCSIEQVAFGGINLLQLAIADTGDLYCTAESCGRLDGRCDARDLGHSITIDITSLDFASSSPDILEAHINATVQTGLLPVSTVHRNSVLCVLSGGGPVKCTVDLDTSRAAPSYNQLSINIKLAVDTRWDRLLALQVADVGGARACGTSGASPLPGCLDPNDIVIANEGGCGACTGANLSVFKTLLIDQLAKSLKTQVDKALGKANCAKCDAVTACPTSAAASATCDLDAGACIDTGTNKCVPGLLGMEGRLDVAQSLGALGAASGTPLTFAIGAGGSASATDAGITIGLRGGFEAQAVSSCVAPAQRPTPPTLPLPDFDTDAPVPYAVGVSLSQQYLAEALFQAQQSGALCLELGTETIAALESDLLATLLPSLKLFTGGKNVPLRLVLRPVTPPTATVGEGTVDTNGMILDPLLRLEWTGLEMDLYAWIEERPVRLFTLVADLNVPLGVELDGCSGLTPVVGSLTSAITVSEVKNSEVLAEPLDALKALVPSLLSLAEPQLAAGLSKFTLPAVQGFQLRLLGARGIGRISGTSRYHHLALYADVAPDTQPCTPNMRRLTRKAAKPLAWSRDVVELEAPAGERVSWRVAGGFWSAWTDVDSGGRLVVQHPRLWLDGAHHVELRTEDGELLEVSLDPSSHRR
ncbi:MAG: hypothetical protein AB1938_32010 [Myxococcota bacterium]